VIPPLAPGHPIDQPLPQPEYPRDGNDGHPGCRDYGISNTLDGAVGRAEHFLSVSVLVVLCPPCHPRRQVNPDLAEEISQSKLLTLSVVRRLTKYFIGLLGDGAPMATWSVYRLLESVMFTSR
jgi:hypothetical protein